MIKFPPDYLHYINANISWSSTSRRYLDKLNLIGFYTSSGRADDDTNIFFGGLPASASRGPSWRYFSLSGRILSGKVWGCCASWCPNKPEEPSEKPEIEDGDPQEDNTIVIVLLGNEEYAVRKKHLVRVE